MATPAEVAAARQFIETLVGELVSKGCVFVVPVDAEKLREGDNCPVCFDWLIWESIDRNLARRPTGAPNPLAVAVQHHKTEDQVPADKAALWDKFRASDLVSIDNASSWNMASKRMEMQAYHGDILITLGGSEGVLFLANLYHQAGKPVIPLNFKLEKDDTGSRKLFSMALTRQQTGKFFQTTGAAPPHDWINRLNFSSRQDAVTRVRVVVDLLESIEPPTAFCVRLLNPSLPDYTAVENFFSGVIRPVVEQEFRYTLKVVDGNQPYEFPRIDQEIFEKLHRAGVVISDLTGERPNCYIELGYALGRSLPTIITAKVGTRFPFDIHSIAGHMWDNTNTLEAQKQAFRAYWVANINKPPLVSLSPLIP